MHVIQVPDKEFIPPWGIGTPCEPALRMQWSWAFSLVVGSGV